MKYDAMIMGAGLFGLSIAYALLQKGWRVLVLEKSRVAESSSAGLVGAMAPHMPENWNAKKDYQFRSMQLAAAFWPEIERATGMETGYQKRGRLQFIASAYEREKALMRQEAAPKSWGDKARWQVRDDLVHPFRHEGYGVVFDDLSAQIFPQKAIMAFASYLREAGVEILENTSVDRIESGKLIGVQEWHAEKIVIAGGYAAWPFLRPFMGTKFGEGIKGQAALIALDTDWDFPMITGDGFYIVPHEKRLLGLGSTSERYWSHRHVDENLDALIARIESQIYLPRFEIVERWAGVRPRAYRPDPLMGEIAPDLYVFAGGFKTGFSFANLLALDLANFMDGEAPQWPSFFDVRNNLK